MIIIIINNGNFFNASGPTIIGGHFDKHWLMNFIYYLCLILFLSHCCSPLKDTSVYRAPKAFLNFIHKF